MCNTLFSDTLHGPFTYKLWNGYVLFSDGVFKHNTGFQIGSSVDYLALYNIKPFHSFVYLET